MQTQILAHFPRNDGKNQTSTPSLASAEIVLDWTEMVFFPKLLAVVATTNTTILFGKELAEDPKILQAATSFPLDVFNASLKLRKLTYPFKFLNVELGIMPEATKVRTWISYVRQAVPPVLKAREQASQNDPVYKKPNDFIQWLYDDIVAKDSNRKVGSLGIQTLFAMSAAVHTTGMNLVNLVHHVAWFPKHNAALREEIDRVWAESNGNINNSNVAKLDKLDSYIMEASRHGNFKRSKPATPSYHSPD